MHYAVMFPEIYDMIKKRHKKLLDYDAARSKYQKAMKRPSDDPAKLPKIECELRSSQETYEAINSRILEIVPQVVNIREQYLFPSAKAYLQLTLRLTHDVQNLQYSKKTAPVTSSNSSEQILSKMRGLQIISG